MKANAMLAALAAIAPSRFYTAANNTTKPKKNRDKVKAARKQNRKRK